MSQNSEKSPPSSYIDLDITFKSPKRAIANLIDSTYIETTPVLPPRKRTKNSTHKASESKRSCRTGSSKQSSTLTQMFGGITQLSRSNRYTSVYISRLPSEKKNVLLQHYHKPLWHYRHYKMHSKYNKQ